MRRGRPEDERAPTTKPRASRAGGAPSRVGSTSRSPSRLVLELFVMRRVSEAIQPMLDGRCSRPARLTPAEAQSRGRLDLTPPPHAAACAREPSTRRRGSSPPPAAALLPGAPGARCATPPPAARVGHATRPARGVAHDDGARGSSCKRKTEFRTDALCAGARPRTSRMAR
eukprot:7389775-Prymnesium_polylepis.1